MYKEGKVEFYIGKQLTQEEVKEGMFVAYVPGYGNPELGRVKSVRKDTAFVVYNCGGQWNRYEDYTGCSTRISNLYTVDIRCGIEGKKDVKEEKASNTTTDVEKS